MLATSAPRASHYPLSARLPIPPPSTRMPAPTLAATRAPLHAEGAPTDRRTRPSKSPVPTTATATDVVPLASAWCRTAWSSTRRSGRAAYDPRMTETGTLHIQRLGPHDAALARTTFAVMAEIFGETHARLSDAYLAALLARPDFWTFAATHAGRVVGGLTAHVLLMTAREGAEVFLYDIAVAPDRQRRGIGRRLVEALRREASSQGISTIFVLADDDDPHALRFYAALGGRPSKVTLFEFRSPEPTTPARPA